MKLGLIIYSNNAETAWAAHSALALRLDGFENVKLLDLLRAYLL